MHNSRGSTLALKNLLLSAWPVTIWLPQAAEDRRLHPIGQRVFALFMRITVALVVVQSVAHLSNVLVADLRIDTLNADYDRSAFGWTGTVSEFSAAMGSGLLGLTARDRRRQLTALTLILIFLSFDDAVAVHERLSSLVTTLGPLREVSRMTWPVIYAPLMAFTAVLLVRISGAFPQETRRAVQAGLLALGLAVMLEFSTPFISALGYWKGDVPYELEVILEEGLELGGWLAISGALLANGLDFLARGSGQTAAPAPE